MKDVCEECGRKEGEHAACHCPTCCDAPVELDPPGPTTPGIEGESYAGHVYRDGQWVKLATVTNEAGESPDVTAELAAELEAAGVVVSINGPQRKRGRKGRQGELPNMPDPVPAPELDGVVYRGVVLKVAGGVGFAVHSQEASDYVMELKPEQPFEFVVKGVISGIQHKTKQGNDGPVRVVVYTFAVDEIEGAPANA